MRLLSNVSYRWYYVWRRNLDVNLITWQTNALPPVLEPVLYIFAFGFGLGKFVKEIPYDGRLLTYVQFIAPGMISVAVLFHSFYECLYGSFVRMYYQKTFDAMISTPLLIEDVIVGEIIWGATKSFVASILMLLVISFFGLAAFPSSLFVLPLALFGGLLFASLGMFFTSLLPSIDTMNLPVFLISTPMFLFSGTFFPIESLPPWAQLIGRFSPLTHLVNLVRSATLATRHPRFLEDIVVLVGLALGLFALSLYFMKRRLLK